MGGENMPKKQKDEEKVAEQELVIEGAEKVFIQEGVLVVKANRMLSTLEHKQLSEKLRYENEKSGVKLVLLPFSCDPVEGENDGKSD